MKISVVVPVYNVEKYLRECVDRLLRQTVPAHEIILVDDGSKDNSGVICDEYAAQYTQVKVVHKQNAGLGMARNTGLEHVTGDFVTFVDSDDFCQTDMLEHFVNMVSETGCDTCKIGYNRVDLSGGLLYPDALVPNSYRGVDVRKQLLPRMVGSAPDKKDSIPMSAWCTLYSIDIIRTHDLWFVSERQWISEDIIFNIAYYMYAKHVVLSDYIGYNYRTNPKSLTTSYRPDRFEKCLAIYHEEKRLLSELGLYEICCNRLIRQFLVYMRMCFAQLTPQVSKLPRAEALRQIREICANQQVQQMIWDYPVKKLGIKQQVFVYLVKFRMADVLYHFH